LYDELRVAERGGEGIQADASFHQHGPYLNSGSYGASFAKDTARCLAASWGTEFQAPEKVLRTYLGFLLEGQQWMVFQGLYDYSTWGRAIVRPKVKRDPETYFNESINRPIRSLSELGVPRAVELRSFLDRWEHRPDAQPLVGHRHFWKSDYTVHRGRDYTITLRMHSERTINAEFINGEGGTTHFLADGAVFLYREGDEYQDIFAVWDWRQIPGTTCVQSPAPLGPEEGLGIRGSTRFVGGVSNGRTGVSAMDLEKEFLKAKKAWFFFKDEIVCLGAGITSADGEPVATSIEQRLLEVPVRAGSGRDMQEVTGSYAGHPEWILHDGVRYKFPTRQEIRIEAGPKQGRWSDIGRGPDDLVTKGVFQIWIDHGIAPREATYEYRIVPGFTSANGEELEGVDPSVVFSNTRNLQAVYDPSAKTLQAVFWRGGRVVTPEGWEFSVDEPCLFQAVIGATEVEFSLANPENEPLEVRLTTSLPLDGLIERGNRRREILIDLPDSEQAGASLTNAYAIKRNQ
jgi:chondroitin AC lyase